jgi:hypothetical protein
MNANMKGAVVPRKNFASYRVYGKKYFLRLVTLIKTSF